MIRYKNNRGGLGFLAGRMTFMAPDNGATATTGSSGAGNGAAGGDGQNVTSQPGQGAAATPAGLYDQIKWDELDAPTRTILEAARADHQRIATQNATLQTERDQERTRALQLQQQLGAPPQQQQQQQKDADPILDGITATLRNKGFTQQQIDQQAPILADVMKSALPTIRSQIGTDLAPFAGTVIAHENTNNFTAVGTDPLGSQLLAIPEVAQGVWNIVEQQTKQGKTFGVDAVLNLAKMLYTEHQFATNGQQQQQQQQPPTLQTSAFFPQMQQPALPSRSTGAFTFPGAHLRPATNGTATTNNGPAMNEDTRAALAVTFGEMARTTGVAPAMFPSDRATAGAGARGKK